MLHYIGSFEVDLGFMEEAQEVVVMFMADIQVVRNNKLFNQQNCFFNKETGEALPTIKLSADKKYHFDIFPNFLLKEKLNVQKMKKDNEKNIPL
jgi:hypothetical protein